MFWTEMNSGKGTPEEATYAGRPGDLSAERSERLDEDGGLDGPAGDHMS
jgi:hypothetical protein